MQTSSWQTLDLAAFPSPCFVVDEARLRRNLAVLDDVQRRAGCTILLALKAFSMFSTFPLLRRILAGCCASGVHEARLAREEFGGEVETFAPAYSDADFAELLTLSDTLVFNSFSQWKLFRDQALAWNAGLPPARQEGGLLSHDRRAGVHTRQTRPAGFQPAELEIAESSGFYDPSKPVEVRQHHLPHWQQDDVYCFVTFRLADALPREKLKAWELVKDGWLLHHPKPWDDATTQQYHALFGETIDAWLDAGEGSCQLRDPRAASVVFDALKHFDGERYELVSAAVMPNHVHVLFHTLPGYRIDKILHSWKAFSAKGINRLNETEGAVWEEGYWDRLVRNEKHFQAVLRYIRENPDKAGLGETEFLLLEKEEGKSRKTETAGKMPASPSGRAGTPALPKDGTLAIPFAGLEARRPVLPGVDTRPPIRFGIRVNPEFSEVGVALYNPCAPNSRLGVTRAEFDPAGLDGITGLHFHCLCEQNADALEHTLAAFEEKFGEFLPRLTWVNFGGGHHITRDDYDVDRLVRIIQGFRARHPNIETVYLEPGEAVGLNTGVLVSTVLDVTRNGMDLAILDTSAECHMPDVLAMPYRPVIVGAGQPGEKAHTYRLGGPTCLAGDIIGDFSFDQPLRRGDRLFFLDMAHYSMVKTTTFNGINLPSILLWDSATPEQPPRVVRAFGYADFKNRLS